MASLSTICDWSSRTNSLGRTSKCNTSSTVPLSAATGRVLALAVGAAFLVWWARRQADPVRYLMGVLTVAALLSPVLHPWYLVWLIPCLCFYRPAPVVALTGFVVLAYTVWPGRLADGRWVIPVWARTLEYAPVFLLGLWELKKWGRFYFSTPPLARENRNVPNLMMR